MSNSYYEMYQKHFTELKSMMKQYNGDVKSAKKLRGALAVELLRREITEYLTAHNKPFKVSVANSYVAGSTFEYDLLIVKESAIPYMGLVYRPEDVIVIIECKAGGLFDVDKGTNSIARAINCAIKINPDIRFGYITLSENVPVNEYNSYGKPTVKHWELTKQYFIEKIDGEAEIYAVTLHQGKKLIDEGSDMEFSLFIDKLIENRA